MQKTNSALAAQRQYQQLRRSLSHLGYLSQGSVQDRTARQDGGAGYQWTRKVAAKTVTVSLGCRANPFGKTVWIGHAAKASP